MNSRSFLAALAAAFVVFVWQSISHMALPWFHDSLNKFENEAAMVEAFKANAKVDGIYHLPQADMKDEAATEAAMKQMETGVSVFVAVRLNGRGGMAQSLVHQFIYNLLGALFVTFLLTKLSHSGTGCRVGVTVFFALFAIATAILPNWSWRWLGRIESIESPPLHPRGRTVAGRCQEWCTYGWGRLRACVPPRTAPHCTHTPPGIKLFAVQF